MLQSFNDTKWCNIFISLEVKRDKKKSSFLHALENIQKEVDRGRLGFKRKYVRC